MKVVISQLMNQTGVQFGTSGVRGLVSDMTDRVCFAYVTGFLLHLKAQNLIAEQGDVAIAGDLRSSSPRIMNAAAAACIELGYNPINCGFIPSPAVALYGIKRSIPSMMVTGSHIPDDRNGIKFNTPLGEILKPDELSIKAQEVTISESLFNELHKLKKGDYLGELDATAENEYIQRFTDFFPAGCLAGKKVGLYQHSSVARDCIQTIFEKLGATVTTLARSEQFVSVDTEAIRPEDVILGKEWAEKYGFDCIVSTDGDADRPLISDEYGDWLRGDVAGVLCSHYLNADTVVTPVSSNTAVEKSNLFAHVIRTRIGSPYVIEAMQNAEKQKQGNQIVGYEANGGFLQQTVIEKNHKYITALPTRDSVIVLLSVLLQSIEKGLTISELLASLPERYTHSDRIKAFPTEDSLDLLAQFTNSEMSLNYKNISAMFPWLTNPSSIDITDGVRITFENAQIVHLRPSGNAPELRCYTEASTVERAQLLCKQVMDTLIKTSLSKM